MIDVCDRFINLYLFRQSEKTMDNIQLRSDTMTVLTPEMRQSMLTSQEGVWQDNEEDKLVRELQNYAAQLLGKNDAAYVPSGVFGNQCCILTAGKPGEEILIREKGHIIQNENGSVGRLARMATRTIDCPEGFITPQLLDKHLHKKKDPYTPHTGILVLEFPTFQGLIPPLEQFHQCARLAKKKGIHVHVDGARLFSGIAQLKIDPSEILKGCSSATFCLSKGLCAPVGSIIVGDSDFIARVKINRKIMGGHIKKAGVVAAAGLIGLKKMRLQLWKDNEMARLLSERMVGLGWFSIAIKVETNMIFFNITDPDCNGAELTAFLKSNGVLCSLKSGVVNRFVIHHYIREKQVETLLSLLQQFKELTGRK